MVGAAEQPIDFFISRAGADAAFADAIGRILEDAGHTVVLQQWDFANRNFMERMHSALATGARVIALLSNEYLNSDHCAAEWQNTIAHDPLNRQARLIVMRVDECAPEGLLTALPYWDLLAIRDDPALLHDVVLAAVDPGRHKGEATSGAQYWRKARAVVHPEIKATPSFTGRESELDTIDAALWFGGAAAVHGLGGIGKSVLAREYAHRNRDRYAGVWWLNAAKPENAAEFGGIEAALVDLGAVFIPGLDEAQDRAATARTALNFIAHGGFEKPWLLIYDNVDDARALREWAPVGNTQVLVTSRLGGWSTDIGAIEIAEWPQPDAIRYLLHESARKDLTEGDAQTIAKNLGCLPLAISHATAYLRVRPNVTAEKYLDAVNRRMTQAPKGTQNSQAVFASLQECADQAETESTGARAVLSLAAFYAPDAVPEELFQQPADCYPAALAELVTDPGAVDDAIGALAHLSLIDFDSTRRVFSVHRLAQAAARDAVGAEGGTWAESALRAMSAAFPEPEPHNWALCERLVTHARAVAGYIKSDSRALAYVLISTGTYLAERAALGDLVPLYERGQGVLIRLVAADPANTGWQRDLSVAQEKVGDALRAQGKTAEALESYRVSLAIRERLAATDPGNARWQRDLSVSHNNIGRMFIEQGNLADALESYRTSMGIRKRLAAADPGNAGWQRDLSGSHGRIGNVLHAQGHLAEALQSYRASMVIRERLVAADPENVWWQRDLSVAQGKIGDVLQAQGQLAGALESYRASIGIAEHLAATDPGNTEWQRDLSVAHNQIGDLLRLLGNQADALESYRASMDIRKRLAAADPGNAVWQRDLSVAHVKIGDVLRTLGSLAQALVSYQASMAIRDLLAKADAGNAGWQRDLSIAHDRIGDVLRAQGNLADALESYRASLAIRGRLAKADPGNAGWQHDVSFSLQRIGLVAAESGERDEALAAYRRGLGIVQRLVELAPDHAAFRRDLAWFEARIAELRE